MNNLTVILVLVGLLALFCCMTYVTLKFEAKEHMEKYEVNNDPIEIDRELCECEHTDDCKIKDLEVEHKCCGRCSDCKCNK